MPSLPFYAAEITGHGKTELALHRGYGEMLKGLWEEGREQRAPEEELERVFKAAIEKSF